MMGASSAINGGGFGFGYGFGVRLGYDTYGAIKDMLLPKAKQAAIQARYSPDGGTSHAGSGFLSALSLNSNQGSLF